MLRNSCQGPAAHEIASTGAKFSFLNDSICLVHRCGIGITSSSMDDMNYSQAWLMHHKYREHAFKPWSPVLGSFSNHWEILRLQTIQVFWKATRQHRISPITVHLSVWIYNKLLHNYYTTSHHHLGDGGMTKDVFAGISAVAFRTALKFEERPDALWSIRKIWEVLPLFDSWQIDRSDQYLMKMESEALRILDDCFDVPLALQFFDSYILIGGWPEDLVAQYTNLGHYLIALSTFTGGDVHPLVNVSPSKLAAATVVLSVKIVNGDSRRSYEFFPERFAAVSQCTLKELQPSIKGMSAMLRKKPNEVTQSIGGFC